MYNLVPRFNPCKFIGRGAPPNLQGLNLWVTQRLTSVMVDYEFAIGNSDLKL